MTNDPLSIQASSWIGHFTVRDPEIHEPDLFLCGNRFLFFLNKTYNFFDVITYTRTKSKFVPLKNVKRCIFGVKQK